MTPSSLRTEHRSAILWLHKRRSALPFWCIMLRRKRVEVPILEYLRRIIVLWTVIQGAICLRFHHRKYFSNLSTMGSSRRCENYSMKCETAAFLFLLRYNTSKIVKTHSSFRLLIPHPNMNKLKSPKQPVVIWVAREHGQV